MEFLSKGRTLLSLSEKISSAKVPFSLVITYGDWIASSKKVNFQNLARLSAPYIVRSSSVSEDNTFQSNAGKFLSIPQVSINELANAIDSVFSSYGNCSNADEVLIQSMLNEVKYSGVGFSHDPNTLSPYRVINWSEGPNTAVVTGGLGGKVWQQAALSPFQAPIHIQLVIDLIDEILELFNNIPIDIEYALTSNDESKFDIWLLQARPLILSGSPESNFQQIERLDQIAQKVQRGMKPHPFLMGKKSVYGVMPDWNPAEIIGIKPRPLALSLYRELVTDNIWAYQRHNYGYRNLRSFPLMPHFLGLPYIDVRLSFNSFIPASLPASIASKLVDYYIDKLIKDPHLHDKVEFEIVFSCYTLDLPQRLKSLLEFGFSEGEIEEISTALRSLTNNILNPSHGLLKKDSEKMSTLASRREQLYGSSCDKLERIYWLLEDTKRYGTLPFAGLARAGFVAVQMLQSLVNVGIITESEYNNFLSSISTVSGQLAKDREHLDRPSFLARYGHLRPGTYDILSARYDEVPDLYFDWNNKPTFSEAGHSFALTINQMRDIATLLKKHQIDIDPISLFDFIQTGIEMREASKFAFTRNLSDAISLIKEIGFAYDLSAEELSFSDISIFTEMHIGADSSRDILLSSISQGKSRYKNTLSTSLPPVITSPKDVYSFAWPETSANFITQDSISADVVLYDSRHIDLSVYDGCIVCIPNADPGFDWIFSYNIAGLITAWGGCNSHMAIRCAELSIPALIGVGEIAFLKYSSAHHLSINCAQKSVEIIR